ncbi:hypothetical protein [Nitrosococcus halophilus]|uniref:hypothetical protein n=1 Tax=Nitrosococcus halophilus TaxID=133539 RepID=UPI0002DBE3B3|nr:hypothetical protein [Nitrosococcus halophilus]
MENFEYEDRITVIKKERGTSVGVLKYLKGDASVTDEKALQDTLEYPHPRTRKHRTA